MSGSTVIRLVAAMSMLGTAQAGAQQLTCLMSPNAVADVGTQVTGVLESISVDRGVTVTRGQAVARLKSDVEAASVRVASVRAQAQAELRAAEANVNLASSKLERNEDLYRRNFVSVIARDEAATEAQIARARVTQARETLLRAERELSLANAQLEQRMIRSPISGVVIERYLSIGERVDDKPILKVASLDPLRVEVLVPSVHFAKITQGMTARIRPDVAGFGELEAQVTLVDRVIDPASNTFRVRLELPNPNNEIPSGMRCKADLGLDAMTRAQAAPAAAQAGAAAAPLAGVPAPGVTRPVNAPDRLATAGVAARAPERLANATTDERAAVVPKDDKSVNAPNYELAAASPPTVTPAASPVAGARPGREALQKRDPLWWERLLAMVGFKQVQTPPPGQKAPPAPDKR